MTLEQILRVYFGLYGGIDTREWAEAYGKLIDCLQAVGEITEERAAAERMIAMLDKIDTQEGEV